MPVTTDQVLETLRPVEDPELHRSIVDLGMVRDIKVGPDGRGRGARRAHRRGVPAAQRDHQPRDRCGAGPARRRRRRSRLHRHDRPGARGPAHAPPWRSRRLGRPRSGPRSRRGPQDPLRREQLAHPAAAHLLRQGRRRQELGHHQPGGGPRPAGPLGRRRRRRRLRLLHPSHARHRPRPGRDRQHAAAPRAVGRAVHLHRLLRARGPGRHLARSHAAQGPRAVPHRRVLGRARLPARRHATRHRRHRPVAVAVPASWRGVRGDHAAARGPEGGAPARRPWPSG